jgi:CelD/BcsL family acetyltransferase involved in cellulose biosynthesis
MTARSCTHDLSDLFQSPKATVPSVQSIYKIDPLQDPRWSELIAQHPRASAFHTRGWLSALQATYGYEPIALTTSSPSQSLTNAVVFCVVRSWLTGDRLVSLPFSDHCEPLVEARDQLRQILSFAESLRLKARWKYVELRSADSRLGVESHLTRATTYHLHRLDLRPGLDVLRQGFHKDCIQRKINRAERESLSYEAGRSPLLLQQLYGLLQLTRARHHLPPQPFEWFQNLVECLGKDLCIRIALKDNRPIAGILTLDHGKTMVYKYGGSDTAFSHLGGTAMLFWKAIQDAKAAGMEELDLGRSDLDNPGLGTFKDRWSATRTTLTTYRSPGATSSPSFDHIKTWLAKEGFARLPESALTLAGRLLYRHIG